MKKVKRIAKIPVSYCPKCNNIFLNDKLKKCLICGNKREEVPLPPRHQYREVPSLQVGREFYLGSIDLDKFEW